MVITLRKLTKWVKQSQNSEIKHLDDRKMKKNAAEDKSQRHVIQLPNNNVQYQSFLSS